MVPLSPEAAGAILGPWDETGRTAWRRRVMLNHACVHRRPGLWADDGSRPRSVVWLRPGEGQWEAIAAGRPEPAVGWLAELEGTVALLAPASWGAAVRAAVGPVEHARVATWRDLERPGRRPESREPSAAPAIRRLGPDDAAAFQHGAPAWSLRSWGGFEDLAGHGAAFGVPRPEGGFAALAWTLEDDGHRTAIGVFTAPRYRRLGLGRAVATTLIDHLVRDRGRQPLWTTTPENHASQRLAEALGFATRTTEPLLRWSR